MEDLITQKELSIILGVTERTIQDWKNDPDRNFDQVYDENNPRKVNLRKCLLWMYEWKKECESTSGPASERKKLADALNAELKYKKSAETLVPKRRYIATEKERFLLVKAMMLGLSEQLSPTLKLTPLQKDEVYSICKGNLETLKETFTDRAKDWEDFINSDMTKEIEELKALETLNDNEE